MVFIVYNPEEKTIALQFALRFEEAGIATHLFRHEDKEENVKALAMSKAVILILSPFSLTTFNMYKPEIENAQRSKKTIFPLLYGMSRAEFDTKQTQWKEVVGSSATMHVKEETIGESIPKIVSGLRGIGIKPNPLPDIHTITFIRSQLRNDYLLQKQIPPISSKEREKKRSRIVPLLVGITVVFLALAGGYFYFQSDPLIEERTILRIHGSNTIGAKLLPSIVEGFIHNIGGTAIQWRTGKVPQEKYAVFSHPDSMAKLVIEVFAHGSAFAFKDLRNNTCDIGMSSREIKYDEAILLQTKGLGNMYSSSNEHVLALDGLAIIVHPSNPVKTLTVEQVGKIFSGEIVNWKSLTGENATITLYARDTNSGTHETFHQLVMKRIREDQISGDAKFYEDSGELSRAVEMDPHAIGFLGFTYANENKVIAISESNSDPLFANFLTIGREDYPLARRLYLYTSATPANQLVREFVRYALSEKGQHIVHANKFVDLNVRVENNPSISTNASKAYTEFVQNAKRISVNLRFQRGKDFLDTKAQSDLERVVEFLKENNYPQLKLIGFTDTDEKNSSRERLSLEQAEEIAGEFKARGINIPPSNIAGFGAEDAITTSKTSVGKFKNRRVEVWLQ
ncbi:MAG: substrate-binding domain-containing protein [Bacteroidota bacterium]